MKKAKQFKDSELVKYTFKTNDGRLLHSKAHEVIRSYIEDNNRFYVLQSTEGVITQTTVEESRLRKINELDPTPKKPSVTMAEIKGVKAKFKDGAKITANRDGININGVILKSFYLESMKMFFYDIQSNEKGVIHLNVPENEIKLNKSKVKTKVKTKVMAKKKTVKSKTKTTSSKGRKAPTKKVATVKAPSKAKRKVNRMSTGMKLASNSESTKLQGVMEMARKCMVEGKDDKARKKIDNQLGTIKEGIKTGEYKKEVATFMAKVRANNFRIYNALKGCVRNAETTKLFNDGIATFKGASKSKGYPETI